MSDETIVAIYDTAARAESAVADLQAAGVPQGAISQHAGSAAGPGSVSAAPGREKGFWSSLFGGEPDHDTAVYDRSLQAGSSVVSVRVPAGHADRVAGILEGHHPIDIDERATGYGLTRTTTTTRAPGVATPPVAAARPGVVAEDAGSIRLAEESLVVGKRLVNRGGTRIRRFVVETPVEQQVTLHDERVVVERRPVTDGRPLVDGSFGEKTIEMSETREQAVVSKTARVVEEVGLRKQGVDRVETVRDTVRREDVAVEQVPGTTVTPAGETAPTRGVTPRT